MRSNLVIIDFLDLVTIPNADSGLKRQTYLDKYVCIMDDQLLRDFGIDFFVLTNFKVEINLSILSTYVKITAIYPHHLKLS